MGFYYFTNGLHATHRGAFGNLATILSRIFGVSTLASAQNQGIFNRMKIGVMGAKGSFSEEAALVFVKKHANLRNCKLVYLITSERVLDELEKGAIDIGILALENSTMGVVISTVHAMAKHRFKIKKIFEIDVHHNLLVRKGTKADKIKTIVSQDPALKQCRFYLKRVWPKAKLKEYADTAKAAEDLSAGKLPASCAVIASKGAAKLYKLDILDESIQDLKFNFTSFVAAEHLK